MSTFQQLTAEILALDAAILKAYEAGGMIKYSIHGRSKENVPVDILEKIRDGKRLQLSRLKGKSNRNVGIRFNGDC